MRRLVLLSLLFASGLYLVISEETYFPAKLSRWVEQKFAQPIVLPPNQIGKTEEQWIVDQTARDLAEIIFFAKTGQNFKADQLTVKCSAEGKNSFDVTVTISAERTSQKCALKHYLWASDNYIPLATRLLTEWKIALPPAKAVYDTDLLSRLDNADIPTLIGASREISQALTQTPLDPTLHEEAALIIGSFALREAAGSFSDVRFALSRMTAHLALARALRPEQTVSGKIAEIIQLSLVGRQTEAFIKARSLPRTAEKWSRALQIRTTGDWRILREPATASRLEQLEYFRALRDRGFCPKARAFLSQVRPKAEPDWSRIAMEEYDLSVDDGQTFAVPSSLLEVKSLSDDWRAFSGMALSKSQLISVLNEPATRCVDQTDKKLEVLNWGMLAAFHQRHLCHAFIKTESFLQNSLGVPEDAKKFRSEIQHSFGQLTLFPLVRVYFKTDEHELGNIASAADRLTRERPEMVTAANWSSIHTLRSSGHDGNISQEGLAWFSDFPLFGTAYDFWNRHLAIQSGAQPAVLEQMVMLAPFDHQVLQARIQKKLDKRNAGEQLEMVYASIKDFDLRAMWEIAEGFKDNPETYGKLMKPICELHPDYFILLGEYYVEKKMPEMAATAYQNAFERAEDRVYMANSAGWIVDYYFDHGRTEDALKIARDAAEVYSSVGLCTMGHLMERMKRFPEAEDYYKKVSTRYDDPATLGAFYIRNRDQRPEYSEKSRQLQAATFPTGLESAQLTDFKESPHDGVSITSSNSRVREARLKRGDVIVAINSVRVHTEKQYMYVRNSGVDPNMTLIVWNGAQYAEHKVDLPERRFYCEMADFKSQ